MQANSTMTRVSERCTGPSLSSAVIGFEVPEGHAAETFRGRIDDALRHLIPASP